MGLIDFIKEAFKKKGVDEKYAEPFQKTFNLEKEEDVEKAVEAFMANMLPLIKKSEEDAKKDDKQSEGGEDKPDLSRLSPELKALFEAQNKQISDLATIVTGYAKTNANAEKSATAKGLLSSSKLPESWLTRIDLESETPLADQVKVLKTEYIDIQQQAINDKVASGEYIPGSVEMKDRSVEDWAKMMDADSNPSDPGKVDLGLNQ